MASEGPRSPRTSIRVVAAAVLVAIAGTLVVLRVAGLIGRDDGVDAAVLKRAEETASKLRALEPPPPTKEDLPPTPQGVPGRGPQRK